MSLRPLLTPATSTTAINGVSADTAAPEGGKGQAAGNGQQRRPKTPLQALSQSLLFEGPITLSGVKINNLDLVKTLGGHAGISGTGKVLLRARGPAGSTGAAAAAQLAAAGRAQDEVSPM